jgi:hypothetical protein
MQAVNMQVLELPLSLVLGCTLINVYGSRSFDKNSWWVTCGKMTIDVLWQKFFIVGGMI